MNKIIFCQTPFQIIVALLIKEQFAEKEDRVDLVIVNSFACYNEVAERIRNCNIFNNVFVSEVSNIILAHGIWENIKKFSKIFFSKKFITESLNGCASYYDEMYCWNYDVFTAMFRSVNTCSKRRIKLIIFDEGYISYFPIEDTIPKRGFMKIIEYKNAIIGKTGIRREDVDGYLLFEPESVLFKSDTPIIKLDRNSYNKDEFLKTIEYVFNIKDEIKRFDRKYIIFEEAMLANQEDIDDKELFIKISEIVGKENVMIKLHPRTKEGDRFKDSGIKTLQSGAPWEAIALCGDFKDKVLIAISSGAITSYRMMVGNKINAFMLYKFMNPTSAVFKTEYSKFWSSLQAKEYGEGILIPSNKQEFEDILTAISRQN